MKNDIFRNHYDNMQMRMIRDSIGIMVKIPKQSFAIFKIRSYYCCSVGTEIRNNFRLYIHRLWFGNWNWNFLHSFWSFFRGVDMGKSDHGIPVWPIELELKAICIWITSDYFHCVNLTWLSFIDYLLNWRNTFLNPFIYTNYGCHNYEAFD